MCKEKNESVDFLNIQPRSEEEYLNTRVLDQIKWYDEKSCSNKWWFQRLKIIEIIISLVIPFLSANINENDYSKYVIGVMGIIIAAIAGIVTLTKLQENWIEYRTVAESLKYEKFLFLARSGPYNSKNSEDIYKLFVERFESLISTTTKKWGSYINDDIKVEG